jgi:hypothetical protein
VYFSEKYAAQTVVHRRITPARIVWAGVSLHKADITAMNGQAASHGIDENRRHTRRGDFRKRQTLVKHITYVKTCSASESSPVLFAIRHWMFVL